MVALSALPWSAIIITSYPWARAASTVSRRQLSRVTTAFWMVLVQSPKVATYDEKPEMSAYEVKDKLVAAIDSEKYVELAFAVGREILGKCVVNILLVEDNVHTLERAVVGGHAIVLQTGNGVHSFLGHILLREHFGEFLGAVISTVLWMAATPTPEAAKGSSSRCRITAWKAPV